jgi:hypothetical protein
MPVAASLLRSGRAHPPEKPRSLPEKRSAAVLVRPVFMPFPGERRFWAFPGASGGDRAKLGNGHLRLRFGCGSAVTVDRGTSRPKALQSKALPVRRSAFGGGDRTDFGLVHLRAQDTPSCAL